MYPNQSIFGIRWRMPAVLAFVLGAWMVAGTPAFADNTAKCGGDGEKPCPIGVKATFIEKAQTRCPNGSFFDLASFACWSCPGGYNRTGAPASTSEACLRKLKIYYEKADKDKKVKFSKDIINNIKKGKFDKICKGNSYYDKKGGKFGACWECPTGYIRNYTSSVTGKEACVKVVGLSRKSATKVSGFNPCRIGFLDPRNGGQCWSCPGGYFRGPTAVTSNDACIIKPTNVCDSGNILVYSKCMKKGACGGKGERPCLIVERVPSCQRGLAEDFIANKCVDTPVALCLAIVRLNRGADGAVEGMKKLLRITPGLKKAREDRDKTQRDGERNAENKKKANIDNLFADAAAMSDEILTVKKVADKAMKRINKIRKAMLREKFCTMSQDEAKDLLVELDLKPEKTFKKASVFDGWNNPFVKSAQAARDRTFYMSYAVGVSGGVALGGTFELNLVTDYDKHVGSFVSIGPAAITNAAVGASVNIGFYWRSHIDDFKGWGFGMGVGGGPPAPPISVGVDFFIPKDWHTLEGMGFNVGAGIGYLPADGNFSASYAWRMW